MHQIIGVQNFVQDTDTVGHVKWPQPVSHGPGGPKNTVLDSHPQTREYLQEYKFPKKKKSRTLKKEKKKKECIENCRKRPPLPMSFLPQGGIAQFAKWDLLGP